MFSWRTSFARAAALPLLVLAVLLSHAQRVQAKAPVLAVEGLGRGTVALSGPWQFHLGDNPAWAAPDYDDASWEHLSADKPWGEQGHARYTGFAWYRCAIAVTPGTGTPEQLALLLPEIDDASELYWNGSLIAHRGKLPPDPVWYYRPAAEVIGLGRVQRGVLAVRVWKAPLLSDDSGQRGGFEAPLEIGSPRAIANAQAVLDYEWLRSRQYVLGEGLIYAIVACLSFLLWCRNPRRWLLFWMAGFAVVPCLEVLLLETHISWPYTFAMGVYQPLSSIRDLSLWFLLLWLLCLRENRGLTRLTRILAGVRLGNASLDGLLVAITANPGRIELWQTADAVSAVISATLEAFPLVLISYAFFQRKRLDRARWQLAIVAFVAQMLVVVGNVSKQGRQFTNWDFAAKIDSPLFTLGGSAISLHTLAGALLLISVIYAVYNSIRADQIRQDALEREKAELLHASEQMRYHAEHDGLTGLWNHRIIVERLRGEIDRSQREGTSLSVILADVDHFKKINDTFGHRAGDQVLKEIGAIFTRSVRSYDWVGRYGGEEFLLILPGTDAESAIVRAEELRLAVQSARILDCENALQVTASFGVASTFPSESEVEAVIRTVDEALYRAKNSGRNRVVTAETYRELCES